MPKHIFTLDSTLIGQIKAGEVIERPSSVVRELLDNAKDAKATQITCSITEGGVRQIKVIDNGTGIDFEDLPSVFLHHSTSKLKTFDDLNSLCSYGFRGEALASIGAISDVQLISNCTRHPSNAWQIHCNQGTLTEPAPTVAPIGTQISVDHLFFYVPARRKFLKTTPSEARYCQEAFVRSALISPQIAMNFIKDQKKIFTLPVQTAHQRVCQVMGSHFQEAYALQHTYGNFTLHGWITKAKSSQYKESQFFYVNERYTKDKLLHRAIKNAVIQSLGLGKDQDVEFFIHLQMPKDQVDVNAHPAKTEVRFRDSRAVYYFVNQALASAFSHVHHDQKSQENIFQASTEPLQANLTNTLTEQTDSRTENPLGPIAYSHITPLGMNLFYLKHPNKSDYGLFLDKRQLTALQQACALIDQLPLPSMPCFKQFIALNSSELSSLHQWRMQFESLGIAFDAQSNGVFLTHLPQALAHLDWQISFILVLSFLNQRKNSYDLLYSLFYHHIPPIRDTSQSLHLDEVNLWPFIEQMSSLFAADLAWLKTQLDQR